MCTCMYVYGTNQLKLKGTCVCYHVKTQNACCICMAPYVATYVSFCSNVIMLLLLIYGRYPSPMCMLPYFFCWPSQHAKQYKEYWDDNLSRAPSSKELNNQKNMVWPKKNDVKPSHVKRNV